MAPCCFSFCSSNCGNPFENAFSKYSMLKGERNEGKSAGFYCVFLAIVIPLFCDAIQLWKIMFSALRSLWVLKNCVAAMALCVF